MKRTETRTSTLLLTFAAVAVMMVLGGTSLVDVWYNIPVRITAVVMIAMVLLSTRWNQQAPFSRLEKTLFGLILAIPLVQLLPLPAAIWSMLGNRAALVPLYEQLSAPSPWLPASLTPSRTLDALFWLSVPLAGFLAGRTMPWTALRPLIFFILIITGIGLILGMLQVSQGESGNSYLYQNTNFGSAVGFFSNRNHHGALLASCIPLAYLLIFTEIKLGDARKRQLIAAGVAFILSAGAFLTESRAATLLALISWVASVVLIGGLQGQVFSLALRGSLALGGLLLIFQETVFARFARFNEGFNRSEVYPILQSMISDNWLIGTGIGSFRWAALAHEDPAILGPTYWNHAHNDWAQIVAEGGLPGLAAIIMGCLWLYRNRPANTSPVEGELISPRIAASWAAWIIVLLLLTHSLVDYPLRTSTLAALFGLCLGWLAKARSSFADSD